MSRMLCFSRVSRSSLCLNTTAPFSSVDKGSFVLDCVLAFLTEILVWCLVPLPGMVYVVLRQTPLPAVRISVGFLLGWHAVLPFDFFYPS